MTGKEKMQKQMLHVANNDRNLLRERTPVKDLCHQYNRLRPSDTPEQERTCISCLAERKEPSASWRHSGVISVA